MRRLQPIWFIALLAVLTVILGASNASAQDVDQCISSSAEGQKLRDEGDLIKAEQQFVLCASNSCPVVIRRDCQNWLSELGPSIPSITLKLRGGFVGKGRVLLDGRQIRPSADEIRVNPGVHEVVWELDGHEASTSQVTVGVGSRGKEVVVTAGKPLKSGEKKAAEEGFSVDQIPVVSWILGGVGVAGIGAFTALGIASRVEYDRLSTECNPSCAPADTQTAKDLGIAADISLLVGVASLGTGAVLAFVLRDEPSTGGSVPNTSFGFAITPGGAALGVSGRF